MMARELIASFEVLAEAPDGVKRLRELVLQLAVRGRLVPQVEGEEAAGVLLERNGHRVKSANGSRLLAAFSAPESWAWVELGTVAVIERGGSPRPIKDFITEADDGLNWIMIGDTEKGSKYITSTRNKIRPEGLHKTRKVFPGDFLLTNSMSFGRPYICEIEGCIHDGWLRIQPPQWINKDFLFVLLSSGYAFAEFTEAAAGAVVQNLNTEKVRTLRLPVPPLAEQHRIVAKVDELMAFLDKLEAAKAARDATRRALRDAALAALREADSPDDVELAWGRIAEQMDELFAEPEDVAPLRQAVLQLAVRGRLVRQVAGDEPAGVLLERIGKEKARLVKEGKIRKSEVLSKVTDDDVPFALPNGWEWHRIGNIAELINGDRSKNYPNKEEYVGPEGIPFINTGHIRPDGTLSLDSMHYISRVKFDSLRSGKIEIGDLVYCLRGATIGKTAFVEPFEVGAIASSLVIVRPYFRQLSPYLYRLLTSPHGMREVHKYGNGSAQPNLSAGNTAQFLLPLPPLAEQHRIVAKVDELMALLDNLESRLRSAKTLQAAFAAAAVHHLDVETNTELRCAA